MVKRSVAGTAFLGVIALATLGCGLLFGPQRWGVIARWHPATPDDEGALASLGDALALRRLIEAVGAWPDPTTAPEWLVLVGPADAGTGEPGIPSLVENVLRESPVPVLYVVDPMLGGAPLDVEQGQAPSPGDEADPDAEETPPPGSEEEATPARQPESTLQVVVPCQDEQIACSALLLETGWELAALHGGPGPTSDAPLVTIVFSENPAQWTPAQQRFLASDAVRLVVAAGPTAGYRGLYESPLSMTAAGETPLSLTLLPPLRFHDAGESIAGGLLHVGLSSGRALTQVWWFDEEFIALHAARPASPPTRPSRGLLDWVVSDQRRLTVILIATLLAYLTVAYLWTVPGKRPEETDPTREDEDATAESPLGPFTNNLGKTVLTGLAGFAAVSVLQPLFADDDLESKRIYLITFIAVFFALLLLTASYTAVTEMIRVASVLQDRRPRWRIPGTGMRIPGPVGVSARYLVLILLDTFANFLRGRNQQRTATLSDLVSRHQGQIRRALNLVRENIQDTLERYLKEQQVSLADGDVRVNISLLAENEKSVFYVSWAQGSLPLSFNPRSVAYISVYTRLARWWKQGTDEKRLLYDNSGGRIPTVAKENCLLGAYFQERTGRDYEAFVVLPAPWRRGLSAGYRKGGLHISFRKKDYFDKIFPKLAAAAEYAGEDRAVLDGRNVEEPVRSALRQSLDVIGELESGLRDSVFLKYEIVDASRDF